MFKELRSHCSHPFIRKSWRNQVNDLVEPMRELRLQRKLLHQSVKKHAHQERYSNQDLHNWSRSYWSDKLVEALRGKLQN